MKVEKVTWRGTPGVGDFMWALNSCHHHALRTGHKINLEMHWEHDEDYYHHFEDPETIIERMHYIHNFYHRQEDVEISHVFNSNDRYKDWSWNDDVVLEKNGRKRIITRKVKKSRFWFESGAFTDKEGGKAPINDWMFRDCAFRETKRKKVVVWTAVHNAEVPRTWKRFLTSDEWSGIIVKLRRAGLDVVELNYRTPVSEAMYHISTCRLVVCYDGMWHYMARNFAKPMLVCSVEGVTSYHTPQCIKASHKRANDKSSIHWWTDNIAELLGDTKKKAIQYKGRINYIYE